jgi:hypothetical protein
MTKTKKEKSEPVCGTCAKPFDRRKAAKAAREGRAFVHDCGRVLVRGNLSALPTHSHVYRPDPDSTEPEWTGFDTPVDPGDA